MDFTKVNDSEPKELKTSTEDRSSCLVLVEDDQLLGASVHSYLTKQFTIPAFWFQSAQECVDFFDYSPENSIQNVLLVTDLALAPGEWGISLISQLKDKNFNVGSIVITGNASIEDAISATKLGAYHYLKKPFDLKILGSKIQSAAKDIFNLEIGREFQKNKIEFSEYNQISKPPPDAYFQNILGISRAMKDTFLRIEKVSLSDSTILITGESGTGKELVAQAIYERSKRADQPFVVVNCGAIPSELLESELFGHLKGAFTGAISDKIGKFEAAHNGTLFLDEIGDLPIHLQVKLLRAIQNKVISPLGSQESKKINIRLITATNKNLEDAVLKGTFREDLFYRLAVIPIKLSPLRTRKEDILPLIYHFSTKFAEKSGTKPIQFDSATLQLLQNYEWPGNVRELENLVERLSILRTGPIIKQCDLPAKIYQKNFAESGVNTFVTLPEEGIDLKEYISEFENALILQALGRTSGNKNKAAKLLGLNRTTLIEKMKKKNIFFDH